MVNEGDPLWTPSPERVDKAHLTDFTRWLARERGKSFASYAELWQRAERAAPLPAHPTGEERLGDRRVPVPDQQRALQRERDVLGDLAGAVLDGVEVVQLRLQPRHVRVQPRIMSSSSRGTCNSREMTAIGSFAEKSLTMSICPRSRCGASSSTASARI